ncbi:unnamed protein product [Didymodactylos carnosus]|uniref:Pre-mRNA splicing factor component Cdc5p/Cef1 C-terminal domain-containing protein n=1 Tax=Didymodactylos carnosus TaxID=1234261 RepID=A0A8S2D5U8_9BILA|nr:unnamed protein product [Didymodactylos carnosus]
MYRIVFKQEVKQQLRRNLARLPTPRNDYEIVLPSDVDSVSEFSHDDERMDTLNGDEDQGDIDKRTQEERKQQLREHFKRQTQAVQRQLPRPIDINHTILRPATIEAPMNDLQKAEELIKQEMLVLLHYDALNNPVSGTSVSLQNARKDSEKNSTYLDAHSYEQFSDDDLLQARTMLETEMNLVKKSMGHGDIGLDTYSKVWDECYSQVLFLPSKSRFTRANTATKKDRIESSEKKLELNRNLMALEAKRAAKLEKKLKMLLGGYQSRGQALNKALNDIYEQIDQLQVESKTFEVLRQNETQAIPKRIEVCIKNDVLHDDVIRQEQREKELQAHYQDLMEERSDLLQQL